MHYKLHSYFRNETLLCQVQDQKHRSIQGLMCQVPVACPKADGVSMEHHRNDVRYSNHSPQISHFHSMSFSVNSIWNALHLKPHIWLTGWLYFLLLVKAGYLNIQSAIHWSRNDNTLPVILNNKILCCPPHPY